MRRHFAFVMALFMALALIPGIALADKGGPGGGWGPGGGGPGGGSGGGQQGSYLNQENWDGSIKVVYDTFEVSNGQNVSKNGAGVTAVTLNGTAVTWQNSNITGAASGAALSSYYTSASSQTEQSVELAITAAEGYYVSRIVVACIDPGAASPYSCKTWSAGNAYDVPFSLARSVKQNDGAFKLSIPLNSKNFCHSSNGSNHGYYILIQVAPIPQPVYVEYDYGEILNMFPGDSKLADLFNNSTMWTTVGSGNAYGNGEGIGNFVPNTKFAYNYSAVSEIQNWKHTTNSISLTAMAAVTPKNVKFLGWEVTYYAKCTKSGNELTFSEQVGTSSNIGEGQSLNVYTHAKLVAQWKIDTTPTPTPEPGKIKIKICKAIDGDGIRELPENYTIKVKVGDEEKTMSIANLMEVEFEVEVGKEYTISETYKSDIPNYDFVKATIWERNIANGFKITFDEDDDGRTIIITNKYVKHGTVIKPGKLTIKKTVEGVDVPDNYEVTVNVYNSDKSVNENIKLNKANSFSHTLELEEDRYYIKETTFTDINGYQLTGMDTQEHRPYDGNGINKIFKMYVSDNSKAAITIVNKYERVPEKAKLTVTKAVEGLENGVELPDDYKVTVTVGNQTITLTKDELSKTISLDAGTYTVRETDMSNIDGYDFVKTKYSKLDANNGITLAEGDEAAVTVTNTYSKKQEPKAKLTIKKTVEGVDIPEGYVVTVAVNGTEYKLNKGNQFRLDIEVAPGKYTIEEKGCTEINGYYCEATTITINGKPTQEIVLENMAEGHVEITNRYAEQKPQNGKLTITKSFRGVYAYDLPRSFTVYVRPMNDDGMTLGSAMAVVLNRNSDNTYSATIEVGYNVYEVTEQNPNLSGYVFTGANYSAVSTGRAVAGYDLPRTNGIYVSTGENGTASVAVTNSYYYDYHDYVPVIPPTKPLPPQTGDSDTAYMGIALCVMAAAAFVAARSRKRS